MWVNLYTIFAQYLPKYVQSGKFLHILCNWVKYYTIITQNKFPKLLHNMRYDCANITQLKGSKIIKFQRSSRCFLTNLHSWQDKSGYPTHLLLMAGDGDATASKIVHQSARVWKRASLGKFILPVIYFSDEDCGHINKFPPKYANVVFQLSTNI